MNTTIQRLNSIIRTLTAALIAVLIAMLIGLVSSIDAKAQITINDPAFAGFLQTNYPAAMTGNVLDDQHPSVLSTLTLQIPDLGITDFTGLEAFAGLQQLDIDGNDPSGPQISMLSNLQDLDFEDNNLTTTLPLLPNSLTKFNCLNCSALFDVTLLPPSLDNLVFYNCPALGLLPAFPSTLQTLGFVSCTSLTSIPTIPNTLQTLTIDGTPAINNLPGLPTQLLEFSCRSNGLTLVSPLPPFLNTFICENNNITCLPDLPPGLVTLQATLNPVNCLPNLPPALSFSDIGFDLCSNLALGTFTNTSCFGSCNGSATLTFDAGVYNYVAHNGENASITPGSTSLVLDSLCFTNGGWFWLINSAGCNSQVAFTISQPAPIFINLVNKTNVSCNGGTDGSIEVSASNGAAPYAYSIDGGITLQANGLFQNLASGMYTITVTDINGCSNMATFIVTEPPPFIVTGLGNVTVCNGSLLCADISGGTLPYSYLWSTSEVTGCISINAPGSYIFTATDANGCTATDTLNVTIANGLSLVVDSITLPSCGGCDGQATIDVNSGSPPYTYMWLPGGNTVPMFNSICEGTLYNVIISDALGCTDTIPLTLSCGSVWPGDADYSGQADNVDLLAIGIGYGTTGPARPGATIIWQAEAGPDWLDTLSSSINYKHIDCNGDGIIAADDTLAIVQNFGLNHPLRPNNLAGPGDPTLYFDLQIDTASTSSQLTVPLMLGTSLVPASDIYGIAFTVSYDTAIVKADSVTMDFSSCWMDGGSNRISVAVNDPLNGRMYGAVSRINHADTSGFGTISTMGIITVDNISARLSSLVSDTLILQISNVTLINYAGEYKNINTANDTLIVNDNTTGITNSGSPSAFSIYPNPADEFFTLQFERSVTKPEIAVYSMLNEKMNVEYKSNDRSAIVNCSMLSSGLYIVTAISKEGTFAKKIRIR
jgi:hypothetical protein